MKQYELSSLELRKAGIYFKDTCELSFQFRVKMELKQIIDTLENVKGKGIPDILEKLNHLTGELNKYYKEVD